MKKIDTKLAEKLDGIAADIDNDVTSIREYLATLSMDDVKAGALIEARDGFVQTWDELCSNMRAMAQAMDVEADLTPMAGTEA